jgi:hypothetical protein
VDAKAMLRLEGLDKLKNPMILSGIVDYYKHVSDKSYEG